MKKLSISVVAIIMASLTFVLGGCDMSISLSDEQTTIAEPDTAVVEVTNEEGTVIATETVTMSQKEKEDSKTFFEPSSNKKPVAGVSQDRLEEALKSENGSANSSKVTTTNSKTDKNEDENLNEDDDPYLDDMNNSAEEEVLANDGAVLRSSQYLTNIRLDDGETITSYKIARRNNNSSYTFTYEGQNIGLIFTDSKIYMLSIDEKEYVEFPKETVAEYATEDEMKLLEMNIFDFERKVAKTTTETVDGTNYKVIVYEDGAKDYYIGTKIMKTVDGDKTIYYDSVSAIAPKSLFTPPKSYKKAKIEESTIQDTSHEH